MIYEYKVSNFLRQKKKLFYFKMGIPFLLGHIVEEKVFYFEICQQLEMFFVFKY